MITNTIMLHLYNKPHSADLFSIKISCQIWIDLLFKRNVGLTLMAWTTWLGPPIINHYMMYLKTTVFFMVVHRAWSDLFSINISSSLCTFIPKCLLKCSSLVRCNYLNMQGELKQRTSLNLMNRYKVIDRGHYYATPHDMALPFSSPLTIHIENL